VSDTRLTKVCRSSRGDHRPVVRPSRWRGSARAVAAKAGRPRVRRDAGGLGVTEIREVLRAWLAGTGRRQVAAQAGVDRKTARRYVEAAVEAGLARDGGAGQLTDELVGVVALAALCDA
jgi:hypothetical protein